MEPEPTYHFHMTMLESVAIRRGAEADHLALAQIIRTAGIACDHRRSLLSELLASDQHFVYLAETKKPFGFVGAGPADEAVTGPATGEIQALFLLPEFQQQGMGEKLLVRGLSVLKRRGFETAFAFVPAQSMIARATFEQIGFERDHSIRREINTEDGTVLEYGYRLSLDDFF